MGRTAVWLSLSLLTISACAPQTPVRTIDTPIDEQELRRFAGAGPATVAGQAFFRQRGGGVVTCAGSIVRLYPSIAAVRDGYAVIRAGGRLGANPALDSRVVAVRRESTCDAQGKFRFANVPEGNWMLVTEVRWEVAGVPQGGGVAREITVRRVDSDEHILTDVDFANIHMVR